MISDFVMVLRSYSPNGLKKLNSDSYQPPLRQFSVSEGQIQHSPKKMRMGYTKMYCSFAFSFGRGGRCPSITLN